MTVALVGPGLAGDDVHHRRLAGAVRADDGAQLARLDDERQVVERLKPSKLTRDAVEVEQGVGCAVVARSAAAFAQAWRASQRRSSASRALRPALAAERCGSEPTMPLRQEQRDERRTARRARTARARAAAPVKPGLARS